ncbi:MAG TPA: histidine--tRNA ligase [Candidatus Saccharimonadales bacterium]|nr:histidine--tRNA ligase [Candidatus Saccharimonadales bacterium]
MALSTQPYKGARDFYPEDKRIQKYMFKKLREVSERFGYEEYDAPILEPTDLYLSKGNQEIIDEQTYTFADRGGRSVTIRTEMTPTVSRMVAARRQELAYPVRWYSIPNLWRYERAQRGRLREFWQYNADIFGVEGVEADHEIVLLADQILQSYGAKRDMYTIYLSSRKLVDELFAEYLGLDNTQKDTLVRLIDRMKKLPYESFVAQADAILTPTQRDGGTLDRLLALLKITKLEQLPEGFAGKPSVLSLKQLLTMLQEGRVTNAKFDVTLMRGFDYYTDMVFEVFDTDPENNRSMFGGGRYDGLVGLFGVEPVPTVGFAMGDVTLQNFLESHELLPKLHTEIDAYVVLIGDTMYDRAQSVLAELRRMGLTVAVDSTGRKLDKQIKTAVKKGIHYAVFVGDAELASGQFKLRNLADGTEETHGLERIVSIAKDRRRTNETPTAGEDEDGDLLA